MDYSKISNIDFGGVNHKDYPDYSNAFICYAELDGEAMTDEQLDELNDDADFVYEQLMERIF